MDDPAASAGVVSKLGVFENGQEVECVLAGRNSAIGALSALGVATSQTGDVCIFDALAWSIPSKRLDPACRRP